MMTTIDVRRPVCIVTWDKSQHDTQTTLLILPTSRETINSNIRTLEPGLIPSLVDVSAAQTFVCSGCVPWTVISVRELSECAHTHKYQTRTLVIMTSAASAPASQRITTLYEIQGLAYLYYTILILIMYLIRWLRKVADNEPLVLHDDATNFQWDFISTMGDSLHRLRTHQSQQHWGRPQGQLASNSSSGRVSAMRRKAEPSLR